MPSYLTFETNILFLFKSFEKKDVQNSVFQDYFNAHHIVNMQKCSMENIKEA